MPKVLIIDDELDQSRMAAAIFEKLNWQCLCLKDGVGALDVMAKERPDLVLLDICMPHLDGRELLIQKAVRSKLAGIRVFFYTSLEEREIDPVVLSAADGYLKKPLLLKQVRELIDTLGL